MTTRTSYGRTHRLLLTPWKTNRHIGNKLVCKSKEVTRTHQKTILQHYMNVIEDGEKIYTFTIIEMKWKQAKVHKRNETSKNLWKQWKHGKAHEKMLSTVWWWFLKKSTYNLNDIVDESGPKKGGKFGTFNKMPFVMS